MQQKTHKIIESNGNDDSVEGTKLLLNCMPFIDTNMNTAAQLEPLDLEHLEHLKTWCDPYKFNGLVE